MTNNFTDKDKAVKEEKVKYEKKYAKESKTTKKRSETNKVLDTELKRKGESNFLKEDLKKKNKGLKDNRFSETKKVNNKNLSENTKKLKSASYKDEIFKKPNLKIIPLGGLEEIGKNLLEKTENIALGQGIFRADDRRIGSLVLVFPSKFDRLQEERKRGVHGYQSDT